MHDYDFTYTRYLLLIVKFLLSFPCCIKIQNMSYCIYTSTARESAELPP